MKRVLVGLVAAATAAAGTAAALSMGGKSDTAAAAPPSPQATTEIIRGDLTDTVSLSGKITFAGEQVVRGQTTGTVTSVAAPGRILRQGQVLYRVDRKPVVLMYGKLPIYRPLSQGVKDGPDVRQLERALKALGHGENVTVDDRFSWATVRAVRAWQKRVGLPQTGVVDAGQVVFLPSKVRVAKADVAVGDSVSPGRQVFTVTGTDRLVHLDLDVADQAQARKGAKVKVELPGGGTVAGKVVTVGAVAKPHEGTATVDVGVRLAKVKSGLADQTPVTVLLESVSRRNILSVPVEALLATAGGGYGVEIGGRVVPIKTGMYGGGRVEISGPGLEAGMKVGVPAK
ncbi:efflux RND transporter periplasmic adaptor subunit [Streptosporangium sp. NPDC000396]|uniref:efflux RND transporter periplasmic adaptor subunit n=1 Tax=Streptosporangium sp. NPDC000396 TaxID=3366185 RepID=UPI0036C42B0E